MCILPSSRLGITGSKKGIWQRHRHRWRRIHAYLQPKYGQSKEFVPKKRSEEEEKLKKSVCDVVCVCSDSLVAQHLGAQQQLVRLAEDGLEIVGADQVGRLFRLLVDGEELQLVAVRDVEAGGDDALQLLELRVLVGAGVDAGHAQGDEVVAVVHLDLDQLRWLLTYKTSG